MRNDDDKLLQATEGKHFYSEHNKHCNGLPRETEISLSLEVLKLKLEKALKQSEVIHSKSE